MENMTTDIFLILDAVAAIYSAYINLLYFIVHENGKKYIRLWSGLVLFYIGIITTMAVFGILDPNTYGREWLRPMLYVAYLIPAWDTHYDWKKKTGDTIAKFMSRWRVNGPIKTK